ncbi:MAG: response regulator [Rhodocyclaceae bacterium]|nr:response regulator [Rhodocyclaceae bacterium]
MTAPFSVFVVDDDPYVLDVVRNILEPNCTVQTFASVEACWNGLKNTKPDFFLLDVRMPGTDGYAFCRGIKDDPELRHIPVTFISAQDTIDARLRGYDAGGEDFIVKPFEAGEIRHKVRVAQQIIEHQRSLKAQAADAEMLSSLVMASIDEYAILVQFLRRVVACESEQEIAEATLEMLQRFRLEGVVQTRIDQRTLTLSAKGPNCPLEAAVLAHVRTMGRIFEFRSRSVHNFERLTMMIHNMPLDDPEFCGRLRDHLCIAAESAEARLKAIETEEANQRKEAGIREAVERIAASTSHARDAYLRDRAESTELIVRLEHDFTSMLAHIEMMDREEQTLHRILRSFSERMLEIIDRSEDTQRAMKELENLLASTQNLD